MLPGNKGGALLQKSLRTRLLKFAGYAASIAILVVLVIGIFGVIDRHWAEISRFAWSLIDWNLVMLGCVAYGTSLLTTAIAWPAIVGRLGGEIPHRHALAIGLAAQIGKYIPGNLAHYVGRAALAKRLHISFRQSGESTIVEIVSAVVAGALVGGTALLLSGLFLAELGVQPKWAVAFALIALTLLTAITVAANRWILPRVSGSVFLVPVAWLCLSFVLAGTSLYLLIRALGSDITLIEAVGIYAIAWVAGFAVPGAPAGIGVREAILIALLGTVIGGAAAVIAAGAHRILTAAVDALVALLGFALLALKHRIGDVIRD